MAESGRILRKDILAKNVFTIGKDYAKSLKAATTANEKWIASFEPIKKGITELISLQKQFKVTPSQKEFLALKKQEQQVLKETANAVKAEQAALKAVEETKQALINTEKKALALENQKNAAQKRNIKLTDEQLKQLAKERLELKIRKRSIQEIVGVSSALTTQFEKQIIRLRRLRRRYAEAVLKFGETSKEATRLKNRIDKLDKSTSRVKDNVSLFRRNLNNTSKAMRGARGAARSLASAMGLLGGALLVVQVIRQAFNTLREFDRQAIAVQKTANLTAQEIKVFKQEVIDLGLSLKGVSIQGLLESSEVAGQLGIKGVKNILGFSKAVELLKLSAKGIGEEAVADFAKFIEVSKDSSENADRLASVITELGNNFATTEKEIISSATEIAKGTQLFNVSAQAVLGLAAATTTLGIQDRLSKTSIRKGLRVIQESIFTGEKLSTVLKLTSLTEKELGEQFNEDASGVFLKFLKGLKSITDSGGNTSTVLKELKLSGDGVGPVIESLAQKYDLTADTVNKANKEYILNIAAQKEADLAATSLDAKIGDLADSWDGLILSIDSGDGVISDSVKFFIDLADSLITNITNVNKLSDSFTGFFKAIGLAGSQFGRQQLQLNVIIKKTEEEQIRLRTELLDLTQKNRDASETEKETIEELERIKSLNNRELQEEIDLIKGGTKVKKEDTVVTTINTEAKKKALTALEGSIPFQESIIKLLEEQRSKLSTTSLEYAEFTKQIEAAEENLIRLKAAIEGVNAGLEISGVVDISEGIDFDAVEKELDIFFEKEERKTDITREQEKERQEIRREFSQASIDLTNVIFDNKIQKLDDEIQTNNDFFAVLLDNETLSEEQRSALEAERDRKNAEIEKKKRAEQRKQAIFNKAVNATEIIANTAVAVSKALAQGGFIFGIPQATIVAALGAIQLATVLTQPIPGFAKGTKNAPEGLAIVDELRPEVHTDKHDNIKSMGSNKGANLRFLEKGDKIHKSVQDYNKSSEDYERLFRASILTSVNIDNKKLTNFQARQEFNFNNRELVNEMQMTRKAIREIKMRFKVINNINNNSSYNESSRDIL